MRFYSWINGKYHIWPLILFFYTTEMDICNADSFESNAYEVFQENKSVNLATSSQRIQLPFIDSASYLGATYGYAQTPLYGCTH